MENCLVKTFRGEVNNDNLPKLGFIRVKFWSSGSQGFYRADNMVCAKILSGLGNFYVNGVLIGKSVDTTEIDVNLKDITSGITIVEFDAKKNKTIRGCIDFDNMQYAPILETLEAGQGDTTVEGQKIHIKSVGNIENLQKLVPALLSFTCTYHPDKVTGDITVGLSDSLLLQTIMLDNTSTITGSLEDFATAQVSKGRRSGSLDITCNNAITLNGSAVANNTTKTIKYGSSMVDPTTAETAQGWQII